MKTEQLTLKKAVKGIQAWKSRFANLEERQEELIGNAIRTAEIGIGSLALGLAQGSRKPGDEIHIGVVPLEAFAALALHGAAFFGLGGKHSQHLANFGDAGAASYLYVVGRGLGEEWRAKKAKPVGPVTAGSDLGAGSFADRLAQIADAT